MDFERGGVHLFERPGSDIRMKGYLKKLKTMKKKFFVLRSTSSSGPARLEYYDSEKKFNANHPPKRSIHLHTCFNINRKSDSRHKYAIALYTKEDCFSVICEDEKEQETWLSLMLDYQNEYVRDGDRGREHYEHVWQITVQPKGLGQTKAMRGPCRLCLTSHNICFIKLNSEQPQFIFQLETVRSLAHSDNLFRMEVGKIAPTGEGELWMQADDNVIAQNLHETILSYMKNMDSTHFSSSTLPRPEFRHRTASESHTHGSCQKTKPRPMSVCPRSTTSPGTSPSLSDFGIPVPHRTRSDSNESKASRHSTSDMHQSIAPLEEESDSDGSVPRDLSNPSSPGSFLNIDPDEYSGGQPSSYIVMRPGSSTPPTHSISTSGYMDMAAGAYKDMSHSSYTDSSSYMSMNHARPSSSVPVPIQHESPAGYMEMSGHMHLPPVKERGSNEGYLPMSPSFGVSPSSSAGYPHPDHSVCMLLSDDLGDFSHPPTRTYSLGSRPVKTVTKFSGYMDMSGRKGVSDNGRSCSAPHLITHHPHQGRSTATSSRTSNMDSPTPSASPLSMSIKSDDSDSFMELDFYRPRTASDSYSYRPRSSSFGLSQSSQAQPHRPRSSSHGQGTRPVRQNRLIGSDSARLSHEMLQRVSLNSSVRGSFDSLKVSSSESLRKLSLEVRAKTSQLSNNEYIDMSFEKRHTPSPQPNKQGGNGYVDMTLGSRKSSPSRVKSTSRSNSKSSSAEKLPESEYTPMSCSSGKDPVHHHLLQDPQQQLQGSQGSMYMNLDVPDPGPRRHDPSPQGLENVDSYILCEPAPMGGGGSGSSVVCGSAKMDSGSQDPRSRSGSGGKEHKKKGLFHRHSHRDAAKHSSKRADQTQQSGTSSFECTVSQSGIGVEKVTFGYDIRQKKSGSSRNSNRKSVPFLSRSLDASSSSSKGVQLKKSVTPPRGSLDSMDEYIEFSPMAVKSDSDSSHSSGSAHAPTIPSDNVVAAKAEPDYIGFEPGRIFSSKRSSGGNYMQMGDTSNLGTSASSFNTKSKFSNKLKRSKSKEENAAASTLANPVVATPTPNVSGTQDLGVVPQYIHASQKFSQPTVAISFPQRPHSASINYLTSPSTGFSFGSDMSSHGVCPPSSSSQISQSSGPASSVTMKSSSPSSLDVFTKNSQPEKMEFFNIDPKRFSDGKANIVDSRKFLEDEPSAVAKAEGGRFGEKNSSNVKPQVWDRTMTTQVESSTTPVETLASPAGPAFISKSETATSQTPTAEGVFPSGAKVEQASVLTADLPSSFMCEESASAQEPRLRKMCSSDRGCCSLTESASSACGKVGMGELSDKSSGANTSSADSGSSGASDKLSQGDSCSSSRGGSSGAGTKYKEVKSPGLRPSRSSAPQLDAVFGLTQPDMLPYKTDAESSTPGLGRGRHSSSTSQAGGGGNSGALPVNPGTPSRHSLTDLSGYEKMSFPSDALSHQQSAYYQIQQVQQQQSPSQQQTPTPGPNGQGILNYVTLDLGSADSVGDGGDSSRSPRNKSRHPSSADEKGESSSYATIDFGKSENLRNSGNKEVKFTL